MEAMIVVGTTCAPWKCNGRGELAWLDNAEDMIADAKGAGHELDFFAALEVDGRGLTPYKQLQHRLILDLDGNFWTFSLDDEAEIVESSNRLVRICMGRNLVTEYAMAQGASHILFLDTDTRVPGDSISKLLEVDHPVVGGNVGAYCMSGPVVLDDRGRAKHKFRVEEHWNTAGFLLVRREVFKVLRWRWSIDDGMTDDPAYQGDQQVWGFGQTWVRKDVQGEHVEPLVPVEERDEEARRIHR